MGSILRAEETQGFLIVWSILKRRVKSEELGPVEISKDIL